MHISADQSADGFSGTRAPRELLIKSKVSELGYTCATRSYKNALKTKLPAQRKLEALSECEPQPCKRYRLVAKSVVVQLDRKICRDNEIACRVDFYAQRCVRSRKRVLGW